MLISVISVIYYETPEILAFGRYFGVLTEVGVVSVLVESPTIPKFWRFGGVTDRN
jgi:hypothetical protein